MNTCKHAYGYYDGGATPECREYEVTELKKAIEILIEELKTDIGYRNGWIANIAMAFKDEWTLSQPSLNIRKIANNAAEKFIKDFIR